MARGRGPAPSLAISTNATGSSRTFGHGTNVLKVRGKSTRFRTSSDTAACAVWWPFERRFPNQWGSRRCGKAHVDGHDNASELFYEDAPSMRELEEEKARVLIAQRLSESFIPESIVLAPNKTHSSLRSSFNTKLSWRIEIADSITISDRRRNRRSADHGSDPALRIIRERREAHR